MIIKKKADREQAVKTRVSNYEEKQFAMWSSLGYSEEAIRAAMRGDYDDPHFQAIPVADQVEYQRIAAALSAAKEAVGLSTADEQRPFYGIRKRVKNVKRRIANAKHTRITTKY